MKLIGSCPSCGKILALVNGRVPPHEQLGGTRACKGVRETNSYRGAFSIGVHKAPGGTNASSFDPFAHGRGLHDATETCSPGQ